MISVRHLFKDDIETIAIFPSIDEAVDWVHDAFLLPGFNRDDEWIPTFSGDLYAVNEDGRRTMLLSSSNVGVTQHEAWLIHKLVRDHRYEPAAMELGEFGWGDAE